MGSPSVFLLTVLFLTSFGSLVSGAATTTPSVFALSESTNTTLTISYPLSETEYTPNPSGQNLVLTLTEENGSQSTILYITTTDWETDSSNTVHINASLASVSSSFFQEATTYSITITQSSMSLHDSFEEVFTTDNCPVPGFWALPGEPECLDCPDRAICPGGPRLWPAPGFWNSDDSNTWIDECPPPSSRCLGGKDRSCEEGFEGNFCAGCTPMTHYHDRGTCSECVEGYQNYRHLMACVWMLVIVMTKAETLRYLPSFGIIAIISAFDYLPTAGYLPEWLEDSLTFINYAFGLPFSWSDPTCGNSSYAEYYLSYTDALMSDAILYGAGCLIVAGIGALWLTIERRLQIDYEEDLERERRQEIEAAKQRQRRESLTPVDPSASQELDVEPIAISQPTTVRREFLQAASRLYPFLVILYFPTLIRACLGYFSCEEDLPSGQSSYLSSDMASICGSEEIVDASTPTLVVTGLLAMQMALSCVAWCKSPENAKDIKESRMIVFANSRPAAARSAPELPTTPRMSAVRLPDSFGLGPVAKVVPQATTSLPEVKEAAPAPSVQGDTAAYSTWSSLDKFWFNLNTPARLVVSASSSFNERVWVQKWMIALVSFRFGNAMISATGGSMALVIGNAGVHMALLFAIACNHPSPYSVSQAVTFIGPVFGTILMLVMLLVSIDQASDVNFDLSGVSLAITLVGITIYVSGISYYIIQADIDDAPTIPTSDIHLPQGSPRPASNNTLAVPG